MLQVAPDSPPPDLPDRAPILSIAFMLGVLTAAAGGIMWAWTDRFAWAATGIAASAALGAIGLAVQAMVSAGRK